MIDGHWDVVIAGGRIAGAAAAWALAPYAERILVADASKAGSFWPQQSSWDHTGNLLWSDLGLLDVVLACGAPPVCGHSMRTDGQVAERDYPADDPFSFRMTLPREVLDLALLRAAASRGNVRVIRPGRVRVTDTAGDRAPAVTVRCEGAEHRVTCELLVLADGRLSRNADALGAEPYQVVPSPWVAMLAYYEGLTLPPDRGYYSLRDDSVMIATPCGDRQWCVSTDTHQAAIDASGQHPAREFERAIAADPGLGPALAAGRRTSPIGGAGKLKMLRRPMSGPGWCLVGDAGYHLDPVTARGTRAALTSVRLLRDRVALAGTVSLAVADGILGGLTSERDAELDEDWAEAEQICGLSPAAPAPVAS